MASRNMNRKRHIGLQQLSALASTGRTLLGPVKLPKFIVDESTPGGVLICSPVRLLEGLDLSSAVGQLLHEAIQAQNREYNTGTTTLLFLVSVWSNAVFECLQQDVPLSVVVAEMSESLNSCIEQVQCLRVSLYNMQQGLEGIPIECNEKAPINICSGTAGRPMTEMKTPGIKSNNSSFDLLEDSYEYAQVSEEKSEVVTIQQANTCNYWGKCVYPGAFTTCKTACSLAKSVDPSCVFTVCKTVIQKNRSSQSCHLGASSHHKSLKLTHSRHFSSVRESPSPQQTNQLDRGIKHFNGLSDLGQLAMSLGHGNWHAMKLVQDILRCQLQTANKMADALPFQFNISEVVTCCLPGMSESHSCVCPGYITLVHPEKAVVAKQLQDRPLRIILVDGDLTETYHHLGFNRSQDVRMFLESLTGQENSSSLWVDSMLDIMIQSKVNVILVRGDTCATLEERCLLNNIVIINEVAGSVLKAFSDITGADRVTYLTQVNEHCIGESVCLNLYGMLELSGVELDGQMPVALTAKGIHLVTVVLSCPVTSKMQTIEDLFWTCAYRVHHALLDQAVFPGGGTVEFLCLSYLENMEKAAKNSSGGFQAGSSWLAKHSEQYKPLVHNALACGWHQYICTVMYNTANFMSEFEASTFIQQHLRKAALCGSPSAYMLDEFKKGKMGVASGEYVGIYEKPLRVYDNVTAKVEAWRRALDLVLLVLQTDAEIITGPQREQLLKSQGSSEFMFL
ncbi:Bardet-Biedl syndrome 12 protein isoform X2 [Rhineura floridana]|nr:Bardet-Biedl syndrome 12 protein isoform X2 [Rhineura floridana]XP_061441153.1 Bardet-Biedl syndrome 12 protein isoform X2 [Rhineura floridana]